MYGDQLLCRWYGDGLYGTSCWALGLVKTKRAVYSEYYPNDLRGLDQQFPDETGVFFVDPSKQSFDHALFVEHDAFR